MSGRDQDSNAPTTMPLPIGAAARDVVSRVDPYIAVATVLLLAIGTVMVYSASAVRAHGEDGNAASYLVRHAASIAAGLLGMAVAMRIPLERWSRLAYPLLIVSVVLLM